MKKSTKAKPIRLNLIIAIVLAVVTIGVYARTLSAGFLVYDDEQYVTQNRIVLSGLTWEGVGFAFRMDGYAANWHPITWLSHMLDTQIDRMLPSQETRAINSEYVLLEGARHPWLHHLTNILLHALSTIILFLALTRMTGAVWKSAFVAALFALHPFHVESVAWVAERKDVLSGLFWMLTMLAYARYAERPGALRYALVIALFAIGLMAKPMLVTLPLVLQLLDFWPLDRFNKTKFSRLIIEKLPLIALSVVSSRITVIVQSIGGAVNNLETMPKIGNAIISYSMYLLKTFWPANLTNPYIHPGVNINWMYVAISAAFLLAISGTAIVLRGKRYIGMGWLWYLVTLVPVIGIVQVGEQAMADRYTYIPLIGVFIIVAWGVPELLSKKSREPKSRGKKTIEMKYEPMTVVPAIVVLAVLATLTVIQTGYWHDGFTLFTRSLRLAPEGNYIAHNNLAIEYQKMNRFDQALPHFREMLKLREDWAEGHNNVAHALDKTGNPREAYEEYQIAIAIKERFLDAKLGVGAKDGNLARIHYNFATMLLKYGNKTEAAEQYRKAIARGDNSANAFYDLACAIERDNPNEAQALYEHAIQLDPNEPRAHNNLGVLLYKKGDYEGAWREVFLCRDNNGVPLPAFVAALKRKMPEPQR